MYILIPSILSLYLGKTVNPCGSEKKKSVWIIPKCSALFSILQASRILKQQKTLKKIKSLVSISWHLSICLKLTQAICPKHVLDLYNLTPGSNQFLSISTKIYQIYPNFRLGCWIETLWFKSQRFHFTNEIQNLSDQMFLYLCKMQLEHIFTRKDTLLQQKPNIFLIYIYQKHLAIAALIFSL